MSAECGRPITTIDRNRPEVAAETSPMTKWLHSGRRRDLCAILYDAGELRAQPLKNRLESHYDERIDPGSFYATLNSLVEAGFLDRRTEGIADVYALSDAGKRALREHYEWLAGLVDGDPTGDADLPASDERNLKD